MLHCSALLGIATIDCGFQYRFQGKCIRFSCAIVWRSLCRPPDDSRRPVRCQQFSVWISDRVGRFVMPVRHDNCEGFGCRQQL